MSELSTRTRPNPARSSAYLLLALWLVLLFGFLAVSFLSVSCYTINRQCTAEFIDGAQLSAHHAFQIEFTAFLFFFIVFEIIQPISLLQPVFHASCCTAWSMRDTIAPPPRAFA